MSICVTAVPRSGGLLCRSGSWASEWFVLSPESPGRQRCTAPENTNGLELMDISIFPWICECFWGIWCRSPPARVPKLKSASVLPQLLQYRRRKRRGTGGLRTAELLRLKEFTKSTCRYGFVHYAAIHCYSVLPSIASRFAVEISKEASGCEGCEARVNCKIAKNEFGAAFWICLKTNMFEPGRFLHLLRPAAGEGSLWQSSEVVPSGQRRWWDAWHGAFKIYAAIQHHSTISDHFCTTLYMVQSSERSWACDDEHWKRFSILKARFQALRMQRWISAINEDVPACVKICGMWASDCGKSPTGLLSDCSLSFLTDSSPIPYWFLCRGASFLYSDRRRSSVVVTDTSCHCPWQKKSLQSNGSWQRQHAMRNYVQPLPFKKARAVESRWAHCLGILLWSVV